MILELNEESWLDLFIPKVLSISLRLELLEPKSVLLILSFKEKYPTCSAKIDQFIDLYTKSEMRNTAFSSEESKINAQVIIELNLPSLCGVLCARLVHSKQEINLNILQEIVTVMKHFGIQVLEECLNAIVEDMLVYPLRQRIEAYTRLAGGESDEAKHFASKILSSIIRKFDNTSEDPSEECAQLLTFCRKNDKITEEMSIAKVLVEKITKAKHGHSLVQKLIKENGTECFWTGSGLRLVLEHCYKLLYTAASNVNIPIDFDLGVDSTSEWVFKHVKIKCKCDHCKSVKKFLKSNDMEFSFKEKKDARTHVETILNGIDDIKRETIKHGSPQTLKLTKIRTTLEAKKAIVTSAETVLKQYIEYATKSDQKPQARPASESVSSSTTDPPTKKVKQ
ncbi:predicted protein [Naegleria gruberi]|uniref:Predicted protein n=1 Tax=Naegleria gruberi TaxID=5762 RepID=D2W507_NAEGR|nr:uncharacterized protein NAEGRDRAFT_54714 [Naegleria gruberi]EFC35843.1 predicted protein [Naegleria gruberi]|eukprot:XP_002668587.1 predicted protein [Naegleria gruberi strain NEG-M]